MSKLLIIDDDHDILFGFETLFKNFGYDVQGVVCGTKVLDIIAQNEIDLIICDLKLPDLDGLSILNEVRKVDNNIGFIMLTGYPSTNTAVKAIKSLADEYIEKPILKFDDFHALIKGLLEKVQTRKRRKTTEFPFDLPPPNKALTEKFLNYAKNTNFVTFFNKSSLFEDKIESLCRYMRSSWNLIQSFDYTIFSRKNENFIPIASSYEYLNIAKVCRRSQDLEMLKQFANQPTLLTHNNIQLTTIDNNEKRRKRNTFIFKIDIETKALFIQFQTPKKDIYLNDLLPFITDISYFINTLNLLPNILNEKQTLNIATPLNNIIDSETLEKKILYSSSSMKKVKSLIKKFAPTEMPVLITGETGTGKELVAREIHKFSNRNKKIFLAINCSSFPENLLESELFGHEKGAFTGALKLKTGLIETGDEGTIFFDEIGDMPLVMQVKLLRVIQESELRRVGSNINRKINIRIIAATNKPLKEMISENLFREDLFYRLNPLNIHLPPLRKREEDIPMLITHFLSQFTQKYNKKNLKISEKEWKRIENHNWPGNVRELIHSVERAVVLADGGEIEDIITDDNSTENEMERVLNEKIFKEEKKRHIASFEKEFLKTTLASNNGNMANTAKKMGIDVKTVRRKIKLYELI